MKKLMLLAIALPLAAGAAPAFNQTLDMKTALLKTLAGPINSQPVTGIIEAGSPQLTMITQMTGSAEPAQISMTKVQDWPRAGCGRLKLVFHQDKMKLKAGGTGNNFFMTQFLDVCSDGSVPEVPVMPQTGGSTVMSVKPGNGAK